MVESSRHLLKRLEPPVRPAFAGDTRAVSRPPIDAAAFGDLLALVATGSIRSDRPVTLDFAPDPPLDDAQLERLAAAADLAESAGGKRAILLLDGRGLVLDVATRRLELELEGETPTLALDTAVYVANPQDEAYDARAMLSGRGLMPPGVADQIERAQHARAEAGIARPTAENQTVRRPGG